MYHNAANEMGCNLMDNITSFFSLKVRDVTVLRNIHDNPSNFQELHQGGLQYKSDRLEWSSKFKKTNP